MEQLSTQERFKRGAADAYRYFQFMAEFSGFTDADAAAIRETRFIIEKHIPTIVAGFYAQLLRFPATRRHFLHKDVRLNQPYLEMRMQHQAGFWRRTAAGVYDEDYVRFVDYVGRAHTSHGADPKIYIPQRYVMGMIGYVQSRIGQALTEELREIDPELEVRGLKAWNRLLMVLLETLTRPYDQGAAAETFEPGQAIDTEAMHDLAVDTYERALGIARKINCHVVPVGAAADLPPGSRRIVEAEGVSIGVFHHTDGQWYALHNSCLHRGGPVCTGVIEGDTITCPWHGYQYNLPTGQLLLDRDATLPRYEVEITEGEVYVYVPIFIRDTPPVEIELPNTRPPAPTPIPLADNELRAADLPPGHSRRVTLNGEAVAVYNVDGAYYATQDTCTHAGGPLSEGDLKGTQIVCPWHASCFNVTSGAVECGPAKDPLKTFKVVVNGEILRVE